MTGGGLTDRASEHPAPERAPPWPAAAPSKTNGLDSAFARADRQPAAPVLY
jgi:hypothetical protein